MLITWVVIVDVDDASIVDVIWGFGFVVATWASLIAAPGNKDRGLFVAILVTV